MMRRLTPSLAAMALALVCLLPTGAAAQQTGSVSGVVFQPDGTPVPGAIVQIRGPELAVPRSTVTSANGLYRFTRLLPGAYVMDADEPTLGHTTRPVTILLARELQSDFILGGRVERVEVAGVVTDIDVKSSELGFDYTRPFFEDLPLDRSYLGLTQLVAGIADNQAFAPNGGGSRQDNTYLMDGVNLTNPLFGYLGTEVNELDIAEIDVKRGALPASFGRSTGFVINAISKSGTDVFAGAYRFDALPNQWIARSDKTVRSPTDDWVNSADLGGPLVPGWLFFYGSTRIDRSRTTRANNLFGALPDRVERTNEYFGKITGALGHSHAIEVGFRQRPTRIAYADIGPADAPSVGTNQHGTNRVINVNYDYFIGRRATAAVKYVHMDEQHEGTAVTDLGFQPTFVPTDLAAMGETTQNGINVGVASLALNLQNYHRDEVKATITQYFDVGPTSHRLQTGLGIDQGVEDLTRRSNGWGTLGTVIVDGAPVIQAVFYPAQPPQLSKGRTYSMFLQDDVTIASRTTLNAGVLFDRDDFIQDIAGLTCEPNNPLLRCGRFLSFGFGSEVQPRLGIAYQVRQHHDDKLYASWGRYYGLDQKSTARSLASGRLYMENANFDPATGALLSEQAAANTVPKNIAPGLKPPRTDEIVVGYAAQLPAEWSIDLFGMYRNSTNFIEDMPTVLPFSGFRYQNDPSAIRRYGTFTAEAVRRLHGGFAVTVSYAWSRFYGNYDQDYAGGLSGTAVFNTSSLIDDGPGAFTDDPYRYGVLSEDRTHVYKVLATWVPPWLHALGLGLFVRGQSGTPWEARGLSWANGTTYLRLLEPAGSHRTPFWTNVDLDVKYGVSAGRVTVGLEGRVLNVFNRQTPLLIDDREYLDPRTLAVAGSPSPTCRSCYTEAFAAAQTTDMPNPTFGQPIAYAPPRRFLLSLNAAF